ncbi:MAG: hypothetical protein NC200_04325 [Candidatus Gastranaerophilales bacterium]|nr:hypothetical protein [Candidatus Gastranaerophilales bacterium]
MGLSSSQARLLNLTSRMHQIEYKAAKLEAEKLQMANESRRVYEDYLFALDKTKIQGNQLTTDGSLTYVDLTYQAMLDRGYQLKFEGDDRVVISAATEANLQKAGDNLNYFVALQTGHIDANNMAADGVYEIYTADQLMSMTTGKNYRLMSNINMSGKNWASKTLSGKTFDGNGYTISGLNNALFSSITGNSTVKNLSLDVSITSGNTNVGGLTNSQTGTLTLENVKVQGNITSTNNSTPSTGQWGDIANVNIGGLIGSSTGTVNSSAISSTVNINQTGNIALAQIGGIVGYAKKMNLENATYNGIIAATNANAGGIAGSYTGTIENCATKGTITNGSKHGENTAVGIASTLYNSTVTNCRTEMNLTAGSTAGVSVNSGSNTISNMYVGGTLKSTYDYEGYTYNSGLCGSGAANSTFSNCIIDANMIRAKGSQGLCGTIAGNVTGDITMDKITVNSTISATDGQATHNDRILFASGHNHTIIDTNPNGADTSVRSAGLGATGASIHTTTTISDTGNNAELFSAIKQYGYILEGAQDNPATGHENDSTWFTNMVNAGMLYIYKPDSSQDDGFLQVSVSTDTNLQEVADESILKKAEAKYEADMKRIDLKDRKYDTDLAALDTERNAIKQEMETLKTVAKENVERTFKLFS